jgi:hypothetical protein
MKMLERRMNTLERDRKYENQRFGRLVIIEITHPKHRSFARCQCDCGKVKIVRLDHILSRASTSCGCYSTEMSVARSTKHGNTKTRLHQIW